MDSLPWRLSKVGIITEVLKKKKKRPPYKEVSPRREALGVGLANSTIG